jgi:hypothetical protein
VVASSVGPEQTIDFSRSEAFRAALADGFSAAGHVGFVPAGLYAHQALTHFDLSNDWAPQILQVDHARRVAAGSVEWGTACDRLCLRFDYITRES